LLPFGGEWRWLFRREDTLWYPTMRLFRQQILGDWRPVFQRIAAALSQLVESKSGPPPAASPRTKPTKPRRKSAKKRKSSARSKRPAKK
jgi:hypothetical protein